MINKHKSNKIKENSNTVRHLNNGTDHRHSKSCCDQSSPARRTMMTVSSLPLAQSCFTQATPAFAWKYLWNYLIEEDNLRPIISDQESLWFTELWLMHCFLFSPRVMWKVWINLCILHHFDSETSHHFKSNFSQLICDKACLTLPRTFPFKYQNRFRNISVFKDEICLIILQKEQ